MPCTAIVKSFVYCKKKKKFLIKFCLNWIFRVGPKGSIKYDFISHSSCVDCHYDTTVRLEIIRIFLPRYSWAANLVSLLIMQIIMVAELTLSRPNLVGSPTSPLSDYHGFSFGNNLGFLSLPSYHIQSAAKFLMCSFLFIYIVIV